MLYCANTRIFFGQSFSKIFKSVQECMHANAYETTEMKRLLSCMQLKAGYEY